MLFAERVLLERMRPWPPWALVIHLHPQNAQCIRHAGQFTGHHMEAGVREGVAGLLLTTVTTVKVGVLVVTRDSEKRSGVPGQIIAR